MPELDVAINALRAKHGADQFESAVEKIRRSASGADKDVNRLDRSTGSLGTTMGSLGRTLAGFVGFYALSRAIKSSISEYVKFESQLAEIASMLDEQTMHYMPEYAQSLSDLAVKYGESTESLARGLYDIVSAGIAASDALQVLEASTKAAKAGLSTTGIAADAITTIINSYQLSASEATRVSDLFFATIKRGKTTFGQLAPTIGQIAALAASAGLSLEEMSAALATMTRAGLQTEIAISALKAIVSTFLDPQKEGAEMARKWGLELNTNTLRTIGLTGALSILKGMSQESLAVVFGNIRALTGITAILQQSTGYLSDLTFAMGSNTQTQQAFEKVTDTTAHKLAQLKEAFKLMQREAIEGTIPLVDSLAEYITSLAPAVGNATDAVSKFMNLRLPDAVFRMKEAFASFSLAMIDYDRAAGSHYQRQKAYLEALKQEQDRLWENTDAVKELHASAEKYSKLMQELNGGLGISIQKLDDFAFGLFSAKTEMANIVLPTEKFIGAMADVSVKMGEIQEAIDTFGMSDFNKQIRGLSKLGEGLDSNELVTFQIELERLKDKAKEFERLEGLQQISEAKKVQLGQDKESLELLKKQTEELQLEKDLIGKTNEEQIKMIADRKRLQEIRSVGSENEDAMYVQADAYRDAAYALAEATTAHEKYMEEQSKEKILTEEKQNATEKARELIKEVQFEREILLLTNDERERAIKLQQLESNTKVLGAENSALLVEEYKKELIELQKAQEVAKIAEEIRSGLGSLIRSPLEALLDNTKDLGDMVEDQLKNIGKNILMTWYDQMVTQKIQDMAMSALFGAAGGGAAGTAGLLGKLFTSARGNAFDRGRVVRMENGGILNSPTVAPLASGTALMAEKKPEAVMPLTRSNGRLAVEAVPSAPPVVNNNITNIVDPSIAASYIDSDPGERKIVNIIRRNRQSIEV